MVQEIVYYQGVKGMHCFMHDVKVVLQTSEKAQTSFHFFDLKFSDERFIDFNAIYNF